MDHLDLESSINDVTDMAAISDLLTAKFTEAIHDTLRSGEVSGKAIERHEWLSALVSFAVLETKLKAEALRKQAGRRLMAAARRFMPAGYLSPTAAINVSFIYLQNQYFCGCRMVQSGYRLCGFHHILAVPSRLA